MRQFFSIDHLITAEALPRDFPATTVREASASVDGFTYQMYEHDALRRNIHD